MRSLDIDLVGSTKTLTRESGIGREDDEFDFMSVAGTMINDVDARNRVVETLKDRVLDFLLSYIPTININSLDGQYENISYHISSLDLSGFKFEKEQVFLDINRNPLESGDGSLLKFRASNIGASFKGVEWKYVFCFLLCYCSSFLFSFVMSLSLSLSLLIYYCLPACLHSLTPHDKSLTIIPNPLNQSPSIDPILASLITLQVRAAGVPLPTGRRIAQRRHGERVAVPGLQAGARAEGPDCCKYSVILFFLLLCLFVMSLSLSCPSIAACLHSLTRHDV
jgi:hypothetical protein